MQAQEARMEAMRAQMEDARGALEHAHREAATELEAARAAWQAQSREEWQVTFIKSPLSLPLYLITIICIRRLQLSWKPLARPCRRRAGRNDR